MAEKNTPAAGPDVTRRLDNTHDTRFHLLFIERLYDGAPRWWDTKLNNTLASSVPGDNFSLLQREEDVWKMMYAAHDRKEMVKGQVMYLMTCMNPDCDLRAWMIYQFAGTAVYKVVLDEHRIKDGRFATPHDREATFEGVQRDLHSMSQGLWDQLQHSCPQCHHKIAAFPVTLIQNKWVYVLQESGQTLTPSMAIQVIKTDVHGTTGTVYPVYKNGDFQQQGKYAFDGRLIIDKIDSKTWHFFLSPVRLGPQALKLLAGALSQDPKNAARRDAIHPQKWKVGVIPDLQPWSTTVKRQFKPRQLKTPLEYIPLVDPFAWTAEIADFDYTPILAAQQRLIQNPNEQAKAFIASTLLQVIGVKKTEHDNGPPTWSSEDKWDVSKELEAVPSGYASSPNSAHAWIDRYQKTLDYLSDQTNFACARLCFAVRFSQAHRVVELACQDNQVDSKTDVDKDDAQFLRFGFLHWVHVVRDLLACKQGEVFTAWLFTSPDAADWIPRKNVLVAPNTKLAPKIGPSLPLHLLMYLSPMLIKKSPKPGEALRDQLEKIGIHATTFGVKGILSIRDLTLTIASPDALEKYIATIPADSEHLRKMTTAESVKGKLELFSTVKDIHEGLTLLMEANEYISTEERTDSDWEENAYTDKPGVAKKIKEKIEVPAKIAKFIGEQSHKVMKATVLSGKTETEIVEKLEKDGLTNALKVLSKEELDLVAASRSLRTFRLIGKGVKVLSGPIGLVIGGCTLVSELSSVVSSLESGDPGAAMGHLLQAWSAALVIVVAGAECVALFTGAAVAAWAGPVGWIAAALMIIGGMVMAWCSNNMLQAYALHCFLGKNYGQGDSKTELPFMGSLTWAALEQDGHDGTRFERQRLALLRMLCGFSTWIGLVGNNWIEGPRIYPSYVPEGAYFDVEIDYLQEGKKQPVKTYKVAIWPTRQDYVWKGDSPSQANIDMGDRDGTRVRTIVLNVKTYEVHSTYRLRTRLVFDSGGKVGLPVTTKWSKNAPDGISNTVDSGEADTSTHEKGESEEGGEEKTSSAGGE